MLQEDAKSSNQVKRYSNSFFLLFSLLFLSLTAKCARSESVPDTNSLCIIQGCAHSTASSSMQEKSPHTEYTIILFRNGIEGKSILITHKATDCSLIICADFPESAVINAGRLKHILSYAEFSLSPQEFLSSFSLRAPPHFSNV